jgi:uncharacterized protein (TIGR04222 family)
VGVVNPFNLAGPDFLLFYVLVCAAAVLAAVVVRNFVRRDNPAAAEAQLSPYDVACLSGGVPGVLRSCLATLLIDKRLQLSVIDAKAQGGKAGMSMYLYKANHSAEAADHEMERVMLREASHENGATAGELLDAARPIAEEIERSLQGQGLMESEESFAAARFGPLMLLALVWMLGFVKLLVGIHRDRPVLFLVVALTALAVVMWLFWRRPLRTRRGEERLEQLKDQHMRLRAILFNLEAASPMAPPSSDLLLAAGLFGLASLNHPDVAVLNKSLKPLSTTTASGSGCGAATGCGGGGDGGGGGGGCGGGGCGGCGGGGG